MSTDQPKELLDQAVDAAAVGGFDPGGYTFTQVDGATQAVVWRGASNAAGPAVALRLTPKPLSAYDRQGVDEVQPPTLATACIGAC
jgi:hypothetical protein